MVREGTSGVSGERRPVTIMFCDLVGSTVLSERLDDEDYAEVVFEYQEHERRVIERHGGDVVDFAGDGIVACFGHPVAHEDDAERAAEAALALVAAVADLHRTTGAELGVELHCRIGLHADIAVIGRRGGRHDVSVFGVAANVAARVQGEAGVDEVLVTEPVLDLLAGRHAVADRRAASLKGIAEPVVVARLTGRPGPRRTLGAPMVGRAAEAEALAERRRRAARGGGGAVVIAGPAGIGKSTLLADLVAAEPAGSVIEVRVRELSALIPFAPLAELAAAALTVAAGSRTDDDLAVAAGDLAATLGATVDRASTSAEHAWQLVIEASGRVGAAAGDRLIVVEDGHWLDASSRAGLEALFAGLAGSPTLAVVTTRPPSPFPGLDAIELGPLAPGDIAALVSATVGGPPDRVAEIVARSDGIPLYAAELSRAAADGRTSLPHSLHASLLARLDRVPTLVGPARAASVLGDEIEVDLLAAVLDIDPPSAELVVDDLVAGHLVRRAPARTPTFDHALLRDAIYGSLLQKERRRLHAKVADALRSGGADADDRAALLAHHFEQAGASADAASCFAVAARRSAHRGAVAEALELAGRGLALVGDDDVALTLQLTMTEGNARLAVEGYGAPGLDALWQRAEGLAKRAGDRLELSSAMNGRSVAALFDGDYQAAIERAERIVALVPSASRASDHGGSDHPVDEADRAALVRAHCSLAVPQLFTGQTRAALTNARRAIALYRPGDDQVLTYGFGTDHGVIARTFGGMAAWFAGAPDASELLAAAIALAEEIQSPISLCLALHQAATIDLVAEHHGAARDRAAQVEDVAERYGLPFYVGLGRLTRAAAEACLGEPGAVALANLALGDLLVGPSSMGTTLGMLQLALCQAGAGDAGGAATTAQHGLRLARGTGELIFEVELALLVASTTGAEAAWAEVAAAAASAEVRGASASAARARVALSSIDGAFGAPANRAT